MIHRGKHLDKGERRSQRPFTKDSKVKGKDKFKEVIRDSYRTFYYHHQSRIITRYFQVSFYDCLIFIDLRAVSYWITNPILYYNIPQLSATFYITILLPLALDSCILFQCLITCFCPISLHFVIILLLFYSFLLCFH